MSHSIPMSPHLNTSLGYYCKRVLLQNCKNKSKSIIKKDGKAIKKIIKKEERGEKERERGRGGGATPNIVHQSLQNRKMYQFYTFNP